MGLGKEQWTNIELGKTVNKTLSTDKDYLIVVDGVTGGGKSTWAIKFSIKNCPWFNIKEDVIFSRTELIDKITNAKPGSYVVIDEAINILFKRDFAHKKQKFLLRLLDMCRDRNLCLIMCVPTFWSIDKHVLEGRVKLRVHIAKTGLAFLWKPSRSPFEEDLWYRKYNKKVCYNWDSYFNAKRTKGFLGYIRFGDLAPKYKEAYLKIKVEKKAMVKAQEETDEKKEAIENKKSVEFGKTFMLVLLQEKGLLHAGALTNIAMELGIPKSTLSERLKAFRNLRDEGSSIQSVQEETPYINNNKTRDFLPSQTE